MTKDSISDRIKVTSTGKLLRRTMGLGHFRSKKNGKALGRKHNDLDVSKPDAKILVKKYGLTF